MTGLNLTSRNFAQLAGADKKNWPTFIVYPDFSWSTDPIVDTLARIHLARRDLKKLKRAGFRFRFEKAFGQLGQILSIDMSQDEFKNMAYSKREIELFDERVARSAARNINLNGNGLQKNTQRKLLLPEGSPSATRH